MTGMPASRGEDSAGPAAVPGEPAAGSPADGSYRRQGVAAAVSMSELALLIAMVAVFIAGLVVVSHFEKSDD
jgi:hypothetical protein